LRRYKLVGTTLARVCTSELLEDMEFDAVVVDEASMANVPYMLVMAAKAAQHLVVVGDPMQLPPISQASDPEAREMMEQDIFGLVSDASTTAELFHWHDKNPDFTSFFDIQYRMQSDLAGVISEVFYEGRLLSAEEDGLGENEEAVDLETGEIIEIPSEKEAPESVKVIDTSGLKPILRKPPNSKGFQPVNDVHVSVLESLIRAEIIDNRTSLADIGIIVPFRSSVWHLRRELVRKHRWFDLEVGTIHTFQGREKQVIFLDTVMTGEPRGRSFAHYSVRPFDETKNGLSVPRLLNVAFSRSRGRLLVLADMDHIRRVYGKKFLGKLLQRLPVQSG
ncbi:DEAD/DEAH box helicase, partial [Balneolaceae bacterium ANBcel3]|nr:DEAD/DEAH box helicase [Balneolaceae bacterium ANBcel3]